MSCVLLQAFAIWISNETSLTKDCRVKAKSQIQFKINDEALIAFIRDGFLYGYNKTMATIQ